MTYLHLLSPSGEPFEVVETRAGTLLADGWSFNTAPLNNAIARVDEVVDTGDSQGAIADAEAIANDIPVEVDQDLNDAGPAPEVQEVAASVGSAPKSRRRFVTNDGE